MANNNKLVVPQAAQVIDQIKFEVAQELGINLSRDGYNGNITSFEAGKIGGSITRRLVQIAEQSFSGSQGLRK
ncbi:alpha/beta-type small acid-soluble spore protein [Paenibacillus sp. Y412MC10]|uniref:alpha/beta-type small acid-soluble spore protein n=1 Tax=Geobacillus sp. (strain Y412MC10) TaxID=481743 RepID=UPI0011AB59DA|nr:alpha/beta-type small acid-soluble spore protein [Paenibacillus sp. Y412MC10]